MKTIVGTLVSILPKFKRSYFIFVPGFYELKTIAINQFNCETEYIIPDSITIYDTAALQIPEVIRLQFLKTAQYSLSGRISINTKSNKRVLLYRAVNNDSMQYLIALDSSIHYYLDENVDVFNNEYKYKIIAKNIAK